MGSVDPKLLDGLPKAGDVVAGKYRVEKIIGVGGMGVVMSAVHVHLGERAAIKFLNGEAAKNEARVTRFTREAWAAAKIKSDHVARVSDVASLPDGTPYLIMEYLEGRDLEDMLRGGNRMDPAPCVDYVLQACEALAEAHKLGIVHRDLKPGNLFVTERADGSPWVKVLDFGISKITTGGDNLTKTSSLMGLAALHGARAARLLQARRRPRRHLVAGRHHVRGALRRVALRGRDAASGLHQRAAQAAAAHEHLPRRRAAGARARHRRLPQEVPRGALRGSVAARRCARAVRDGLGATLVRVHPQSAARSRRLVDEPPEHQRVADADPEGQSVAHAPTAAQDGAELAQSDGWHAARSDRALSALRAPGRLAHLGARDRRQPRPRSQPLAARRIGWRHRGSSPSA